MGSTQKVTTEMARALGAFTQARVALKKYSGESQPIYLNELKKLCLAIESAEETRARFEKAEQELEAPELFIKEVQNQIKAFGLMRLVTPQQMLEAIQRANQKFEQQPTPGPSRTERLVFELEEIVPLEKEQDYLEGMAIQPLTALLAEDRELLEKLGAVFMHTLEHTTKTLSETNRTLKQLATLQGNR